MQYNFLLPGKFYAELRKILSAGSQSVSYNRYSLTKMCYYITDVTTLVTNTFNTTPLHL